MTALARIFGALVFAAAAFAQTDAPDPFADVAPATATPPDAPPSPLRAFFNDNFGFRKEIMSEFDTNADGSEASRQSLGFELLKKFSTETSTIAAFDFQARLVRRDGYNMVPNEMDGLGRQGWAFEYHNLYLDLYNVLGHSRRPGRFNFRIGHSYVPFGLSLQTDTHGTLLQLSNGDNFGFDRDWSAGLQGSLNHSLDYNASYLTGSGYDLTWKGQTGLAALRLALSNRFSSNYGLEGGLSLIEGSRLDPILPLRTQRIGIDARWRRTAPEGLLTFTTELSGGRDASDPVFTQLHQADYLHASRRWGLAAQFRDLHRDAFGVNSSVIGEFTWYLRNDVANSNSHWIKLNVERQLANPAGPPRTLITLQYYFYI